MAIKSGSKNYAASSHGRGKPPAGQKRLTVNMDADLHKRLKRAAVDSDQTIGAIVERLVRPFCDRGEEAARLRKELASVRQGYAEFVSHFSKIAAGCRLVKTKDYGTDGTIPDSPDACPYRGEMSCVSGSGGSICGGFMGSAVFDGNQFVFCQEPHICQNEKG